MKKRLFAALLAGAVALSMVACGGGSSSSAPAEDKGSAGTTEAGGGSYKIDVICKTLSSEYWTYIKAGAECQGTPRSDC